MALRVGSEAVLVCAITAFAQICKKVLLIYPFVSYNVLHSGGVMDKQKPRSFRLSAEAYRLLALLQAKYGVSATAVIEIAIRKLAALEKVEKVE